MGSGATHEAMRGHCRLPFSLSFYLTFENPQHFSPFDFSFTKLSRLKLSASPSSTWETSSPRFALWIKVPPPTCDYVLTSFDAFIMIILPVLYSFDSDSYLCLTSSFFLNPKCTLLSLPECVCIWLVCFSCFRYSVVMDYRNMYPWAP